MTEPALDALAPSPSRAARLPATTDRRAPQPVAYFCTWARRLESSCVPARDRARG